MSLTWTGLAELKVALRRLPRELGDDGADIVEDATHTAETSLRQSYPIGDTGKLRKGVTATVERSAFGAIGTVKSTSRHAHLWEFGTVVRRTRQGWHRGRMPAHRAEGLIPIAQRVRRRMHGKLIDLLKRAGFEVSGG